MNTPESTTDATSLPATGRIKSAASSARWVKGSAAAAGPVMIRSRRTGRMISARNRQLAAQGYVIATRKLGQEVPPHILDIAHGDTTDQE